MFVGVFAGGSVMEHTADQYFKRTNRSDQIVQSSIGLTDEEALRSIRITISNNTTYEDIDSFVSELDKTIKVIKV